MSVFRYVKKANFTMVPNRLYEAELGKGMTFQAIALFGWIANRPIGAWLSARYIAECTTLTRHSAEKALRDLEKFGYLHRVQEVGQQSVWTLYDDPADNPHFNRLKSEPKTGVIGESAVDGMPVDGETGNNKRLNKQKDLKEKDKKSVEQRAPVRKSHPIFNSDQLEEFKKAWNRIAEKFPGVTPIKAMTIHRGDCLNRLVLKFGGEALVEAMRNLTNSPYLLGIAVGQHQTTFVTRFEWFLSEENFLKVWEGHYLEERRSEVSKKRQEEFRKMSEAERISQEVDRML